jgi:hypothetical protein
MRNPGPEQDRLNRLIGGQPSNKKLAGKMTTFSFDYSRQFPIAPAGPFATGSDQDASRGGKFRGRTMNGNGRSAIALTGISIGGSPDTRGRLNFSGNGMSRKRETYITQGKK